VENAGKQRRQEQLRGRRVLWTVKWQRRESLPPTPQLCERRVDQIEVRCVWYLIVRGLPYLKGSMLFRRGVFATCRATMMRAFRAHNGIHRSHLADKPSVGKKGILLVEVTTMIMGRLMSHGLMGDGGQCFQNLAAGA